MDWSPESVRAWVAYMCQQFCLPVSQMDWLHLDGRAFCSLDEQQFVMCAPQVSPAVIRCCRVRAALRLD